MSRFGVGFIGGTRGDRPWLVRSDYDFAADTGAQAAYVVFTVTGNVLIHAIFGICEDTFTGAGALIELGITGGTTALYIAQTTAADLLANELWHDASPTTTAEQIDLTGRQVADGVEVARRNVVGVSRRRVWRRVADTHCFSGGRCVAW